MMLQLMRMGFIVVLGFTLSTTALAVNLEFNDESIIVMHSQRCLKKLGYYEAAIDGVHGRKTRKAVMQFQIEMGLEPTGTLNNQTQKWLKRPSLVLNTQDFAPFHYKTFQPGSGVGGPIPQIITLTCRKAAINCRIVLYDKWKSAQEDVKANKADGLFVIAWNSEREKWLHRSKAIIETEYGFFVHQDNFIDFRDINRQPALLENFTIGVYGPSGTSTSLNKLVNTIEAAGARVFVEIYPDDKPLFEKLSSAKENYAVYSNRMVGETILSGMHKANTRYAGRHKSLIYYVGFSKRRVSSDTVEKFNQAYSALEKDGTILSILANHRMISGDSRQVIFRDKEMKKIEPKKMGYSTRLTKKEMKGVAVVLDTKRCLMWQQSGSGEHIKWDEAHGYVEKLNTEKHAGFSDWRLPTIDELNTLVEDSLQRKNRMYISPIFDNLQQICWSSDKSDQGVKYIDFFEGETATKDMGDTNFVRAVRVQKNGSCKSSTQTDGDTYLKSEVGQFIPKSAP